MIRRAFEVGIVLFLLPAALWACGGGGSSTETSGSGAGSGTGAGGSGGSTTSGGGEGLPCEVDAIIKANCQSCHAAMPVYGATMPLVTLADFHAPAKSNAAKKVYEMVDVRIHSTDAPMPQPPNPPLDATSLDTLSSWIAAGAPGSQDNCGGTGGSGGGGGGGAGGSGGGNNLSCTPDVQLRANAPFAMPKTTPDEYVCFGVDVPVSAKRHITAIAPAVDNKVIVHHMLLFSTTSTIDPAPKPCSGQPQGSRLLSVWAPGGQALELPVEAGMPLEETAHFMVQVHYSNLMALDGQADLSGFDMCTTDKLRPNDADILAFGTVSGINVPAHGSQDVTCELTIPATNPTVNVYGIMPHMHKLGTVISAELIKQSGGKMSLTNRDPWSFDAQYWDETTTQIGAGDIVRTRCGWQNPGNTDVKFGEKTGDEMCFVFASYYPRLPLPNWMLPALSSTCKPTP